MSFWSKLKSALGFGKKEETVVVVTPPVVPEPEVEVVAVVEKPTPTKKPRKPKVEKTPVVEVVETPVEDVKPVKKPRKPKVKTSDVETFQEITEKFKNGLDANKKPYFTKLVKEYSTTTDDAAKLKVKTKIENYMTKNQ